MTQDDSHDAAPYVAARDARLAEKSDAVCRMGAMMLTAGTGSYRVKAAMGRVAQALGIEELEAQVSLNEIVATTRARGSFRTQVVEVPVPVVNADRIAALLRVSLRAAPGLTAAELQGQLDQLETKAQHYSGWAVVAGAAAACAAFAFLNNGRWQECLAAAVAAGCGKGVQLLLRRFRLNQLAMVALASVTACLVYMLSADVLHWVQPLAAQPLHEAAFTSAILFLVPGFPLLTAALDLARFDFTSGMSRLLYATMITLAAALGAWLVAWAFGLSPGEIEPLDLAPWLLLLLRVVASFAGVFGFAITFNTPIRASLATSVIGAVANLARLSAVDAGWNPLLGATAATTLIGLLAGWASQRLPAPRIILSVPAVLIMIPGASTYRALVAMINRDPLNALTNASTALGIVVALAAGLTIARMLTDPAWIQANPSWTHMPRTRAQQVLRGQATPPPEDRNA
ncbi:threonine/serine ThrE exporter family protein [Propionicimonas sp.]|uniref:threonine/serine ThrE exporter family protein n=1 Tax=Propionicimonas sp. TaxID=1955623 RepID=UPI0039E39CA7